MEEENNEMDVFDYLDATKNNTIKKIDGNCTLTISDFLMKDKDGKCILDYIYENKINLDYKIEKMLVNSEEIVEYCLTKENSILIQDSGYNHHLLNYTVSKETLWLMTSKDVSLIEYMFQNHYESKDLVKRVTNNQRIIDLLKKYNREDLYVALDSSILMLDVGENECFIEKFFKENSKDLTTYISNVYGNLKIIDICKKYNRLDLLTHTCDENILFAKFGDITVFEYLVSNNLIDVNALMFINSFYEEKVRLFKEVCIKYGRYDILAKSRARTLFMTMPDGETILETLINNNAVPESILSSIYDEKEKKLATQKLLEAGKYECIVYDPKMLFLDLSSSMQVIDIIIENYDKFKDNYLLVVSDNLYRLSAKDKATLYIKFAKKGLVELLPTLDEQKLLKAENNKRFIDLLLEIDKDTTFDKVLKDEIKTNKKIAVILNMYGVEQKDIDLYVDESTYGTKRRNEYLELPITQEQEQKLNELSQLFLTDGISEIEFVKTMISSYRYQLYKKNPYIEIELDYLLMIKNNNPEFAITKSSATAFYTKVEKQVKLNNYIQGIFNHELGHALHDLLGKGEIPQEYEDVLERIRQNPETEQKIEAFSKQFYQNRGILKEQSTLSYEENYKDFFDQETISKIKSQIEKEKTEIIISLKDAGYTEEEIKKYVEKLYAITPEEYIEQHKRIKTGEIFSGMLYTNIEALGAVSDIIDAIYKGRLFSNMYKDRNNKEIKLYMGHGINYYHRETAGFNEMIANYQEILKSDTREEALQILRSITGNELIDMLDNFYKKNILKIKEPELSETGEKTL